MSCHQTGLPPNWLDTYVQCEVVPIVGDDVSVCVLITDDEPTTVAMTGSATQSGGGNLWELWTDGLPTYANVVHNGCNHLYPTA